MDLASVVAALASVGVRVSGSTPNSSVQVDSSRACPTGLAGPEPSGTINDPGHHFQQVSWAGGVFSEQPSLSYSERCLEGATVNAELSSSVRSLNATWEYLQRSRPGESIRGSLPWVPSATSTWKRLCHSLPHETL